MSWLLVGLIPGLLMVATFGLQRVEAGLDRDTVSAGDVARFLRHAQPSDVHRLARDGMGGALEGMRPRQPIRPSARSGRNEGLPTRIYTHNGVNPEFRQTRHADRV
ncbi:hypothetical protein ABQF03_13850 [Mycolicibacterium phlei]